MKQNVSLKIVPVWLTICKQLYHTFYTICRIRKYGNYEVCMYINMYACV